MQIRDNRLYRQNYGTFEEYCQAKWHMDRRYANRLIKLSEVVENLGSVDPIPISERAVRPLTSLPSDLQREVYQRAIDTAPEGKVTARHVEERKPAFILGGDEFDRSGQRRAV
jgi:hypothetical protein